jgi:hypothetical protein
MLAFDWADRVNFDTGLGEDERLIRNSVCDYDHPPPIRIQPPG